MPTYDGKQLVRGGSSEPPPRAKLTEEQEREIAERTLRAVDRGEPTANPPTMALDNGPRADGGDQKLLKQKSKAASPDWCYRPLEVPKPTMEFPPPPKNVPPD